MKKLTAFLEKHCQWVAIAAGAVYLLWMVYRFVITSGEYTVPVGTEQKLPGDVDEAVDTVAQQLKSQMNGPSPSPSVCRALIPRSTPPPSRCRTSRSPGRIVRRRM